MDKTQPVADIKDQMITQLYLRCLALEERLDTIHSWIIRNGGQLQEEPKEPMGAA